MGNLPQFFRSSEKSKWWRSCRFVLKLKSVDQQGMSRSVRDLRELINVSRLSYRNDDELDELYSESEQDFGGIPLEVSQPSLPKRSKDLAPLSLDSKKKPVSPPLSSGSSGRGSPLPPIGAISSPTSTSPSSSGRSSPTRLPQDGVTSERVFSARKKDIKRSKPNFDKMLFYMDSTVVGDWLTKANDSIKQLTSWLHCDDNFVRFAHFWLSEMPRSKQRQLIEMEFSILMDELYFAFGAGLKEGSVSHEDVSRFIGSVLWEYPEKFHNSETKDFFLNILICLCSGKKTNYQALLSDVQCSTSTKGFVQLTLATRAFAIVNICSGVLEFYKNTFPKTSYTEATDNSIDSKSLVAIATEFAFQAVQKDLLDVMDYLVRNYSLNHQLLKDNNGKSLLFTAVLSSNERMLQHLLKMEPEVDVNEKSPSGNTPLHVAVNTGNVNMVKLLISAGAKVDAWNPECEGATPLHLAILSGSTEIVSAMLEAGCDTSVQMGIPATVTPISLATDLGLEDIIELLSKSSIS